MTEPFSRLRLLLLVVLLVAETALAISLRTSGWIATRLAIRGLMLATAVVLPFIMTGVLFYCAGVSLRRGRLSLRALLALILVIGSYLALWPLFMAPKRPELGPFPLAKTVNFEVFEVAATGDADTVSVADPDTGDPLPVTGPPIITAVDVLTVQLIPQQSAGYPFPALLIVLNRNGGNKLLQATTKAQGGRLVVVANGRVLAAPRVMMPIGAQFQVTGGVIHRESQDVFRILTRSTSPL